jgi:hypothetical protein
MTTTATSNQLPATSNQLSATSSTGLGQRGSSSLTLVQEPGDLDRTGHNSCDANSAKAYPTIGPHANAIAIDIDIKHKYSYGLTSAHMPFFPSAWLLETLLNS